MMITDKINRAIDEYFLEQGSEPRVIVFAAPEYGEFSYEVGKQEGLTDDDAYLNEIHTYRNEIIVAITHNPGFKGFILL